MSGTLKLSKEKVNEIIFSSIGNVLVWYDFALYMPFLSIISEQFLGVITDPVARGIAAFFTMSAGLFCRPIGSLLFGPLGDLFGRKFALCLAILLMAVSTLFIGLTPYIFETLSCLGAAITLVAMRAMQGLAMGGAYTTAMVHLVENAPKNRRGLFGSFSDLGNQIGVLIGGGSLLALHWFFKESEIYEYAWNIPFLVSGLIIPFVLIPINKRLKQINRERNTVAATVATTAGAKSKNASQDKSATAPSPAPATASGIFASLILYKKQVLCTVAITAFSAVAFYTLLSFLPYYLVKNGILNLKDMAVCSVTTNSFMIMSILIGGYLSDIFGRKTFLRLGIICVAVCNYFIFWDNMQSLAAWLVVHAAYGLFLGLYYGGRAAFFAESFPKKIRCTGVSFSLSIAQAIFGGGIPIALCYFATSRIAVVAPITITTICALWAIAAMQDKSKMDAEE